MTIHDQNLQAALSPVSEAGEGKPEEGIALCLSGGGYRAMVFHLGVLWRLNELGYLSRLQRISSVSGGSITAAMLGLKWGRLAFSNGIAGRLVKQVVANEDLDLGVEQFIAAHQPQFLQELTSEEGHHGTEVGYAAGVELNGVIHLRIEHGLEDDLAGFLRCEWLYGQWLVAQG